MTGFSPDVVRDVITRDGGMCAMTGSGPCSGPLTANHRLNRKAGGSKLRNGMSNACAICWHHNDGIESDARLRAVALERGVKLLEGDDPSAVPMYSPFLRQMVQPADDGMDLLGRDYEPRAAA